MVLVAQVRQGEIPADGAIAADIHPHRADDVDVAVNGGVGQAVLGDAPAGHAARLILGLEDGDPMALAGQVEGGGESRRTGADDGDPVAGGRAWAADDGAHPIRGHLVQEVALEPADGDGVALVAGGATRLALVGADPAADRREGIGLVKQAHPPLVVPITHGGDIVGDGHVGGAGGDAEAAGDAAIGLLARRFAVVAGDDLGEGFNPRLRCQLRHRDTGRGGQPVAGGAVIAQGLLVPGLVVQARGEAEGVRVPIHPGVAVGHGQGLGHADIDTEGAPAAAAIVDAGPQARVA